MKSPDESMLDEFFPAATRDSSEVAALRKKARGEALSAAEEAVLARTYRKPPPEEGPGVPHEEIMRRLAERKSRGD